MKARSAFLVVSGCVLAVAAAPAKVFLTQAEALRLAFPEGVTVERKTAFLTEAQQQEARRLARAAEPPDALVAYYVGTKDGKVVGTAYFDTHRVRTMPETILVLVDGSGAVGRIEVLSFLEPEDYLPLPRWYGQFAGHVLDDELSLKTGIRPVAGATLTTLATTEAVRRVLAVHRVIQENETRGPR
ncbi:MAG TPA: FMN-binding protein [Thermoanaerobaculia bacterium]|nr:FMN-binding protein [Thermoanaerobaculia bacterium]